MERETEAELMKNRKNPAFTVPNMSELTNEQLKAEIQKGFADTVTGRLTPAAEVFAELRQKDRM